APRTRMAWEELSTALKAEVDAYLSLRAKPDLFDDSPTAPRRPLAKSTLYQHSEHLRLSASILVESGIPAGEITSLADLVESEHVKIVLRHYHSKANGGPNAFATAVAKTLIDVARYHVKAPGDQIEELKRLASKL